ncbi:MAG TPA: MotA/TolQ/ExbB proton channel family protein [Candidatus Saccharimonadales bacterium]|nr:MotA/TolQ/ExbB proton channel family protein [Candidatus Saccharimonadales bacterium]
METIIIYILLLGSLVGLTFIIERGLALRKSRVIPPAVEGALENCRTADDLPMLRRICQQHPSALSRLLLLADKHRSWNKEENSRGLETSARHEISKLERGLVILEIVVGVAPLLGLVGTVYGLIALFASLGATGLGDNNVLANGIAFALRATLLGLITAIPSLIAWSYYNKKVENHAVEMASLCDEFLRQLYHQDDAPELAEAPKRGRG